MIIKSNIFRSTIPLHSSLETIPERVPAIELLQPLSVLQTPDLPERFNRNYRMRDGAVCNLKKAGCSCNQYNELKEIFPQQDCNGFCEHIIQSYKRYSAKLVSPLHQHFLQMWKKNDGFLYGIIYQDANPVLAGYSPYSFWIKIASANPAQYLYHLKEQRWAHNTVPSDADELVLCLKNYFALSGRR